MEYTVREYPLIVNGKQSSVVAKIYEPKPSLVQWAVIWLRRIARS